MQEWPEARASRMKRKTPCVDGVNLKNVLRQNEPDARDGRQ